MIIDTNGFSYINGELITFYEINDNCTDNEYIYVTFLFNMLTYGQYNGCLNMGKKIINNAIISRFDITNVFENIYDGDAKVFDIQKICMYEKNIKIVKESLTGNMTIYLFCSNNKITNIKNQPLVKSPSQSKETIKCCSSNANLLCKEGSCGMYQRIIFDRKKNITFKVKKVMCTHHLIGFLYLESQKYGNYLNFNKSIKYASQQCSYYTNTVYLYLNKYDSFSWEINCYNYSVNEIIFSNLPDLNITFTTTELTKPVESSSSSSLLSNFSSYIFAKLSQTLILFTFINLDFIL